MSSSQAGWLRLAEPSPQGERRFRLLVPLTLACLAVYAAGIVIDPESRLFANLFTAFVAANPVLVWWAYRRAGDALRPTVLLLAWAATLWLIGALVWQTLFVAAGNRPPGEVGPWEAFYILARLLSIAAIIVAARQFIRLRLALLDALVLVAASVAVGAVIVLPSGTATFGLVEVVALNRPVLSLIMLALVAAAVLGAHEGVPRSIALMGLGEVFIAIGTLIYASEVMNGGYTDERWANLCYATGAATFILSSTSVALRVDRIVRAPASLRIPTVPTGAQAMAAVTLAAALATIATTATGIASGHKLLAITGIATAAVTVLALALRHRTSLRLLERAYADLDLALAETEHRNDQLASANRDLQQANASLRALHVASAQLLNLADERTRGQLRDLLDETGDDLRSLIEEHLDDK